MKLLAKFNLILLSVFGVGGLIIAWFAYSFLINNARREVLDQARLMVANAKAVRDYTADDLSPLLQQNLTGSIGRLERRTCCWSQWEPAQRSRWERLPARPIKILLPRLQGFPGP
jgi:hypothetical protein